MIPDNKTPFTSYAVLPFFDFGINELLNITTINANHVIMILLAVVLSIVAPILAKFIQMAYSRQREYLADAGAVELTRNPEGLASALSKLAGDEEPLVDLANRGTAHMFIVNPLRKMRKSHQSVKSMFSSHPPVADRIARLMALTR